MTLHRGKLATPHSILGTRELSRDDLSLLKEKRDDSQGIVQKLRDPHHRLARFIAAGLKLTVAASRAGYSYNRAYILSADPAFKDLVEYYRKLVDASFVEAVDDYHALATENMLKAERQISEKLDEADENGSLLPTRDLIAISRDAADRFGYGKKETRTNINVDFASALEKAIKRSGKVIETSAVGTSPRLLTVEARSSNTAPRTQTASEPPLRRRA